MGKNRHSAVAPGKMIVGFNYPFPWNAYGIYFGGGHPPGSNRAMDLWTTNLQANLHYLRSELNILVVRIFLLCNACNYGTVTRGGFMPPATLHPKFVEHLQLMLEAFMQERMLVIPSLIDFKAFGKNVDNNGCMEKHAIVRDERSREHFMEQVLERFLVESRPYKDAIYAWEVQNEPVWNTRNAASDWVAGGATVMVEEMSAFLRRGIELIENHGFVATVGHRFSSDLEAFPTGTARQFHFYPSTVLGVPVADWKVPEYSEVNAFVGEFGCIGKRPDGTYPHGKPWSELDGADDGDARSRVYARLSLLKRKGYPLALLWPDNEQEPNVGEPDPIKLTREAQDGVIDFHAS